MNKKDRKRHFAYEALLLLGCLAMLLFITRLWPVLILGILSIFAAVIRLLFLSAKKVEVIEPLPAPKTEPKQPTYADVRDMAFGLIQNRVTELLIGQYPSARWVWENARPREDVMADRPVFVLLNRAGGYRRARVIIQNLQVCDIVFDDGCAPHNRPDPKDQEPDVEVKEAEPGEMEVNYGLIAFEWVEAHVLELNARLNEAIAEGETEYLIPAAELPEQDSWQEICLELIRNGLESPECSEAGILIHYKQ